MYRKKPLIRRMIPWLIALAALGALVVFVYVPIYSMKDAESTRPPVISYYEGDSQTMTMENEQLLFEMDPTTTRFQITQKQSGRVWKSNPDGAEQDPIALGVNKEALLSTLNVTYTTSGGEVTMNNYTYAQKNQTFDLKYQEDGSIRVDYSVGAIERVFKIPSAITKERYTAFTDAMSKGAKKMVSSNYSLIEPEKLDKRDDKAELLEKYPTVSEQPLYVLKSNTKTANKEKLEGYFEDAGYTDEDFAIDQELVAGASENNGPVFNVTVVYRLRGNDLEVAIPYNELKYRVEYPLTYLSPLPMFGAAGTEDDGYMFIPEGGGAIIRYNNGKLSQTPYYANLYGWDYGVQRKEAVSETENAFPVFGATREGGSFICIMEGASSYAGVNADIAGRYNSYNNVYGKYNVLHAETYNVSAKTTQLVYVYEKEIPNDAIVQRYRFLESDNYVAMANAYGDYLRQSNMLLSKAQAGAETPVNVELIGAINKNVVKMGMPVDSVVATTTFDQARDILTELTGAGIRDLTIRMTGWSNGGVRQKVLTRVRAVSELGGAEAMSRLIQAAKNQNTEIYFDGISCFAYNSGLFDGFLPFSNAAQYATREQVHLYPYSMVYYQPAEWMDDYYLVHPDYAQKCASNLIQYVKEKGATGVAFRDIGNMLSADYYPRNMVTREMVKAMNIDSLKEASASGQKVMIKEGNDYALPYVDIITDMNLTGQQYAIIDERIPFYQIALHGLKDFTGESINLSGDYQNMLLECAEYGAGLNFTFMASDTRVLQDSDYSCYTSSGYSFWKDRIIPMITRYQQETAGLNNQRIVGHTRLNEDVAVTTYADGTMVYVNYGKKDYRKGTITVPALDYLVERGKAQ